MPLSSKILKTQPRSHPLYKQKGEEGGGGFNHALVFQVKNATLTDWKIAAALSL